MPFSSSALMRGSLGKARGRLGKVLIGEDFLTFRAVRLQRREGALGVLLRPRPSPLRKGRCSRQKVTV